MDASPLFATTEQVRQWLLPNELSWALALLVYPYVLQLSWRQTYGTERSILSYESLTALGLAVMAAFQLVLSVIVRLLRGISKCWLKHLLADCALCDQSRAQSESHRHLNNVRFYYP